MAIQGLDLGMDDLVERFFNKIEITDSCWLWRASLDGKGYGQIMLNKKPKRAHRISYELIKGKIPEGLDLDHLCRVPQCVNPDHLEPVTRLVNLRRGIPRNSKKVHCPEGHPYDFLDTYGRRRCRQCVRRNHLRNYHKRKALAC